MFFSLDQSVTKNQVLYQMSKKCHNVKREETRLVFSNPTKTKTLDRIWFLVLTGPMKITLVIPKPAFYTNLSFTIS